MCNDTIISQIMVRENWPAYSNRANDAGGPTKGGITLRTLAAWRGRSVTVAELQSLETSEARRIYEQEFIKKPGFDAIEDVKLRAIVVDAAVMSGAALPIKWLQEELGLKQDGILGPVTRLAIASVSPRALGLLFSARRAIFYSWLVQERPTDIANIEGWERRTMEFVSTTAREMINEQMSIHLGQRANGGKA